MPKNKPYLTFVKIKDRGAGLAVVFHDPHSGDVEFCLTQPNLETRIANLEREDLDASVERGALAAMKRKKAGSPTEIEKGTNHE